MPARGADGRFVSGGGGAEVERMVVRLIGDGTSYQKMLAKAVVQTTKFGAVATKITAKVRALGQSVKSFGSALAGFGRKLTVSLTLPLAGMAAASVKAFGSFDQAMTESTSIMGDLSAATKKNMREVALSLSGQAPQSATELAESYFFLASAGLNAEQSIAALPAVMSFSTAGAFDMALATDLLTDAQTALGLSSKDTQTNYKNMVRVSDVFVKANTLANTSVKQVAEAMTSDAGTAARGFGADLETTVAVLAAYADAGKKGAEAGNLFGRATRLLSKAARANADEFKKLGVDVIDKNTGQYRNFIDIVGDLDQAFQGLTDPQIKAKLSDLGFEALAQKSLTPLFGSDFDGNNIAEKMKGFLKELREAGGTTDKVAGEQLKSFNKQMEILRNNVANAGVAIGEILAPTVIAVAEKVKSATKWFRELSSTNKRQVVIWAAVAAAIGPVLLILGGTMVGSVLALTAAFAALVSPIGIAIASLTTIGVAATLIVRELGFAGDIVNWFKKQWENLIAFFKPTLKGISDALQAGDVALAAEIMWTEIKIAWQKGTMALMEVWDGFKLMWKDAQRNLGTGFLRWLAQISKNTQWEFDADMAINIMNEELDLDVAEIGKDSAAKLRAANKQLGILRAQRGALLGRAEDGARALPDDAKPDKGNQGDLPVPTIPKIVAPTIPSVGKVGAGIAGRQAVGAGSAEARSRIAEFLDSNRGGGKTVEEKSEKHLSRIEKAMQLTLEELKNNKLAVFKADFN